MRKNIGIKDRLLRLFIACILLGYAMWNGSWIAAGIGIFTFYEALAGWCVIYQLLGKNSCPLSSKDSGKHKNN
jgi:hypothetical protein